jgi:hypothetical protein
MADLPLRRKLAPTPLERPTNEPRALRPARVPSSMPAFVRAAAVVSAMGAIGVVATACGTHATDEDLIVADKKVEARADKVVKGHAAPTTIVSVTPSASIDPTAEPVHMAGAVAVTAPIPTPSGSVGIAPPRPPASATIAPVVATPPMPGGAVAVHPTAEPVRTGGKPSDVSASGSSAPCPY